MAQPHLRIVDDGGEDVVELVSHRSRQRTDRAQTLLLQQLLPQRRHFPTESVRFVMIDGRSGSQSLNLFRHDDVLPVLNDVSRLAPRKHGLLEPIHWHCRANPNDTPSDTSLTLSFPVESL